MFGWTDQNLVDSTIEYGYYTDNQIFSWANKIFWLIKFGWIYQLFWLIQPNTMVNLKKRFAQANNNFVVAVIIILIFIMNIAIENSNNNILLKKRRKKKFRDCPKDTLFQTGFEPATSEFSSYLPT